MSLRNKLAGMGLSLGLLCSAGAVALAQQTQTTAPSADTTQQQSQWPERGMKRRGKGRRGHEMGGMMRLLSGLDLTDSQKQQTRAIAERFRTNNQTQRDELFKLQDRQEQGTLSPEDQTRAAQLHKEMRASMQQMHNEILAILTPEQRTKLEQRKQEFKERRRERGGENRGQEPKEDQ